MAPWIDSIVQETRFGARALWRNRGLTAVIVATLGLGMGVNAGLIGLVDGLYFRAPTWLATPGTVHRLYVSQKSRAGGRIVYTSLGYPTFRDVAQGVAASDAVIAQFRSEMVVGSGESAGLEPVLLASGEFWSLFNAKPALGRFFTTDEDVLPEGRPVAVLDHGFWSRAMGADVDVLGTSLRIGSRTYTIIGVAPPRFHGLDGEAVAAYVPLTAAAADVGGPEFATRPFTTWLALLVRRRAGVPEEGARADAERVLRASLEASMASANPAAFEQADPRVVLGPVLQDRGPLRREAAALSVWLLGMAVLVLIVACTNIANLLLTRAIDREREHAVRAALGASRSRFWVRSVMDAILLAVLGGAVAAPLGLLTSDVLSRLLMPGSVRFASSAGVLVGMLLLVPLVALLTSVLPALRVGRTDLVALIATRGRTSTARHRARSGLMIAQAGLSAILLVAAGLFLRSLQETNRLDLGYDADRLLVVSPETRGLGLTSEQRRSLGQTLLERAAGAPGVDAAALAGTVPFWRNSYDGVHLENGTVPPGSFATNWVSADYFETTGTRVLRGRALDDRDAEGSPNVVVVSASMEQAIWGDGRGLGQCIRVGPADAPCRVVVGIVENIRRGDIRDDSGFQYYIPDRQYGSLAATLLVRTSQSNVAGFVPLLRRELAAAAPADAWLRIESMQSLVARQTRSWTVGAAILGGLGFLAVGLAVLGLFSLLAWDVSVRAREIGIRIALGSTAAGLVGLVLRRGFTLTVLGLATGLVIAFAIAPTVEEFLFQVPGRDPLTFAGVVITLLACAAIAGTVPALRATRVNPAVLMKEE